MVKRPFRPRSDTMPIPARERLVFLLAVVSAATLAVSLSAGDSVRRYGTPTPGSGDIAPTIWVNGVPRPGDAGFKLRVERALGGTWAFPFLSAAPGDLTYGGVRFLVDPSSAFYGGAYFLPGQGPGAGRGDVPLPIPNVVGLIGLAVFVQAFTLDDFAPNPLGLGATTGLRLAPAWPGAVFAARAVAGAPDPQSVVDLLGNQVVQYDSTRFTDGAALTLVHSGGTALALDPPARRLRIFDATVWPPAWRTDSALVAEGVAALVTPTLDGSRAYVAHTGVAGSSPPIVAYDVRKGPGFGLMWPGPPIRLTGVADAKAMVFTDDSETGFVAALGALPGTPGSVSKVDVRPASATFHQQLARIDFFGRQVVDVAISADGAFLYLPLIATGQSGQLAVVDVATFSSIDQDPGAPGVQHLGGELSVARTPLPDVLGRIVADPRGDEVYCATTGAIVRVNVAPASPTFRSVVAIGDNLPAGELIATLVLSDAGERLYAATSTQVVEIDTTTLLSPRGWPMTGVVGLTFR